MFEGPNMEAGVTPHLQQKGRILDLGNGSLNGPKKKMLHSVSNNCGRPLENGIQKMLIKVSLHIFIATTEK